MLFRGIILVLGVYMIVAFGGTPEHSRYADAPPPAHTGGFGEPTCRACHFGAELNAPGGKLILEGIPEQYSPAQTYRIVVKLSRPAIERGGFELAARFAEDPDEGAQAGELRPADSLRASITVDNGIQYAHQTLAGTKLAAPDAAKWILIWTAPDSARAPVVFHASANAANDDASAFGDFIYTQAARSETIVISLEQ